MTLRTKNSSDTAAPEVISTPVHGYYETLIQNMAGNTCLGNKPHSIVTLQRPSAHSSVPLLGRTICRRCGKEF